MIDDFSDRLAAANRVSIRAVLVSPNQDVRQALLDSGILDPVTIPFTLDDGTPQSAMRLGNGTTPNIQAILDMGEAETPPASPGWGPDDPAQPRETQVAGTTATPAAYGLRSLAPIRQRRT
jgi:hypothetical protein